MASVLSELDASKSSRSNSEYPTTMPKTLLRSWATPPAKIPELPSSPHAANALLTRFAPLRPAYIKDAIPMRWASSRLFLIHPLAIGSVTIACTESLPSARSALRKPLLSKNADVVEPGVSNPHLCSKEFFHNRALWLAVVIVTIISLSAFMRLLARAIVALMAMPTDHSGL
jgi:hypothetical protein